MQPLGVLVIGVWIGVFRLLLGVRKTCYGKI